MSSMRIVAACLACAALATWAGIEIITRRHQLVWIGYDLSEAIAETRRLEEDQRRLRLELSVLSDPDRVAELARQYGMRAPQPADVVVLEANKPWPYPAAVVTQQ